MSSFIKKIWKNRESEHPLRRKLIQSDVTDEFDVVRAEGKITQRGDPFDADSMNDLEERIDEGMQSKTDVIQTLPSTAQPRGIISAYIDNNPGGMQMDLLAVDRNGNLYNGGYTGGGRGNAKIITKGDFAVITGDCVGYANINIDYPVGFNKNNCVLLSLGTNYVEYPDRICFGCSTTTTGYVAGSLMSSVILNNEVIRLITTALVIIPDDTDMNPMIPKLQPDKAYNYKIVIMKV